MQNVSSESPLRLTSGIKRAGRTGPHIQTATPCRTQRGAAAQSTRRLSTRDTGQARIDLKTPFSIETNVGGDGPIESVLVVLHVSVARVSAIKPPEARHWMFPPQRRLGDLHKTPDVPRTTSGQSAVCERPKQKHAPQKPCRCGGSARRCVWSCSSTA